MSSSIFFSIIFFIGFFFCLMLGLYTISLDENNLLNRLFLSISLTLCIWLFCFSIANSGRDYTMILLWRRISALGWGLIYAFVLHFCLLLTRKKDAVLNSKIYLIYLPAIVVVYAFGISPLAPERYNFVNTALGWVNITPADNIWDWIFYLYYIGYVVASLYILYNWNRKTKNTENKRQAWIIIIAFFIAAILGTLTDIIINAHTEFKIPQLAPIIALIPVFAIFYCIKHYGLMRPKRDREVKPGMILSKYGLLKFYKVVSLSYIVGGLVYFTIQYYFQNSPTEIRTLDIVLSIGSAYFITGISLWIVPMIIQKDRIRDNIFIIVTTLSILLITILFAPPTNTTVWVLPTALVLLSLVYNKKVFLISVGISILLTQAYVWLDTPQAVVQIDGIEYIKRISFFIVFLVIAYYVYNVYLSRLKENENKVKLQKIVSEISAKFTAANVDNLDKAIFDMLAKSGKLFQADHAFVYLISEKKVTHEWCNVNVRSISGSNPAFLDDFVNEWMNCKPEERIIENNKIQITTDKYGHEEISLKKTNKKSIMILPLEGHDNTMGLVSYVFDSNLIYWNQDDHNVMKIIINMLYDTLTRINSEKNIRHLAYHVMLTDLPNKRFFDEYITKELKKDSKYKRAFLLIKYKDFNLINLTFGYNYADKIIKNTAEKLTLLCTDERKLYHLSIDSFLLYVKDYKDSYELVELCNNIKNLLQLKFSGQITNGSIGIVELDKNYLDSDILLKHASIAAQNVKNNKKWGYNFFSAKMAAALDRQNQIEREIKQIISGNEKTEDSSEVYLLYQPIIDLKTDRIIAFEALARMKSKKLGEISPDEFIQIAEKTQQIYRLGDLIIRKVCKFLNILANQEYPEIKVNVNISVLQILREEFLQDLFGIIDEYKINPPVLGVELTESVFSDDYLIINEKLMKLKSRGIQIALDDFGTGYSSFARVKELHINCLKIDKFFIDKLIKIKVGQAITGDIISMAHKLGHRTVAEGVENEKQKQYLIEKDCDYMQGYLFSKPVSPDQALKMLKG